MPSADVVMADGPPARSRRTTPGDREVHYIGVNWPHHVFVSTDFTLLGAE
jgi:hypothetical protein